MSTLSIPTVDVSPWIERDTTTRPGTARLRVAHEIGVACRTSGFFYATGHGLDEDLGRRLDRLSRRFFDQDRATKLELDMSRAGRAWRGYFPVGGELTSGVPDQKEGLYFGLELGPDDPRVRARTPLHGPNLFPPIDGFRETVLAYMDAATRVAHRLIAAIGVSLGLDETYFDERYTHDPLVLFRIFNYPALEGDPSTWSVGEHTDYGLLTLLRQDDVGGLEVKVGARWYAAPPVPNALVCNLGDMLERMTGGLLRSTPHRVRNTSGRARLSFPLFVDPNFDARVEPIVSAIEDDAATRWDQASVHAFDGTYGEYLVEKVGRVFPHLAPD